MSCNFSVLTITSKVSHLMERVGALINKLKEQFEQRAGRDAIAITAQMLVNELQQQNGSSNFSSKKVSVIMPAHHANGKVSADEKVVVITQEETKKPAAITEEKKEETKIAEVKTDVVKEKKEEPYEAYLPKTEMPRQNWMFDSTQEVPTLAQQQKIIFELKENADENSINDKLRENKNEVGNSLQEAPVKDLKKAIGINDRFLFINELFRGDETMYERSLKTINSFSILPEAEYWIQRELKLKLAWNESSEAVEHFDQLVRRRFSSI